VRIILRGDSGFCRENLMSWCEENHVDYVFGLAKNKRLTKILGRELYEMQQRFQATGQPARQFKDFVYRTHKSWSRERRVVGKAEHLAKGSNPRFVVTSLSAERFVARALYEDCYCARGDMENRIKEQQLCLFADRTSCQTMRANQLRLWLSSVAYVLVQALRQHGLKDTPLAQARCDTVRLKLLKIGGHRPCQCPSSLVLAGLQLPLSGRLRPSVRQSLPLATPAALARSSVSTSRLAHLPSPHISLRYATAPTSKNIS
jgi:hypothetical protein